MVVPLDRADVIREYMGRGSGVKRLALQKALAAAGLLGHTVHSFYIAAERPQR